MGSISTPQVVSRSNPPRAPGMRANCVTITMDLLAGQGGRFVAAGSRRSPLMHVWHEAADGTVTRYEPDAPLRHWTHALGGYPGHIRW